MNDEEVVNGMKGLLSLMDQSYYVLEFNLDNEIVYYRKSVYCFDKDKYPKNVFRVDIADKIFKKQAYIIFNLAKDVNKYFKDIDINLYLINPSECFFSYKTRILDFDTSEEINKAVLANKFKKNINISYEETYALGDHSIYINEDTTYIDVLSSLGIDGQDILSRIIDAKIDNNMLDEKISKTDFSNLYTGSSRTISELQSNKHRTSIKNILKLADGLELSDNEIHSLLKAYGYTKAQCLKDEEYLDRYGE